jgi:hypothetical protein
VTPASAADVLDLIPQGRDLTETPSLAATAPTRVDLQ